MSGCQVAKKKRFSPRRKDAKKNKEGFLCVFALWRETLLILAS
jgi:hypothetical protein